MAALLPLLYIRNRVLFPGSVLRLTIGKPKSVKLVESILQQLGNASASKAFIAVFTARPKNEQAKDPNIPDLADNTFTIGCHSQVVKISRYSFEQSKGFYVLVKGISRIRLVEVVSRAPFFRARVDHLQPAAPTSDPRQHDLLLSLRTSAQQLFDLLAPLLEEKRRTDPSASSSSAAQGGSEGGVVQQVMAGLLQYGPGELADVLASLLDATLEEKQQVLETREVVPRLQRVQRLLTRQLELLRLSAAIQRNQAGAGAGEQGGGESQRRVMLRQQLKAIQEELGEGEGEGPAGAAEEEELAALERRLQEADMPPEAQKQAQSELRRLNRMPPQHPEHSVIRSYLECMADVPWRTHTLDRLSLPCAQRQLDSDHYGLQQVKRRVCEFLAVRGLTTRARGPILCLLGPPGVGKTSLGKSVAAALGRRFQRVALGGVRDEAAIRGHRRTYVAALPGAIVAALKKAGTRNPVLLLDEVDKLGHDMQRGDPSSALLEVLDPSQNHSFADHYLGVGVDLSRVLFIATANRADTIPPPLLDRMEVLRVSGYTREDKIAIARRHLLPEQLRGHGLSPCHLSMSDHCLATIVDSYTREAGVRSLTRNIAAVCRWVAVWLLTWRRQHGVPAPAQLRQRSEGDSSDGNDDGSGDGIDASQRTRDGDGDGGSDTDMAAAAEEEAGKSACVPVQQQQQQQGKHEQGEPEQEQGQEERQGQGQAQPDRHVVPVHTDAQRRSEGQERARRQLIGDMAARDVAAGFGAALDITPDVLVEILGPAKFTNELTNRVASPGVATGLAWTPVGGDVLFVEACVMAGSGKLRLTGQLGDVMKESAQTAVSWIRSNAVALGLVSDAAQQLLTDSDVHIHFPAGAIPKDGPSAGVTTTAALLSALFCRPVRGDTAMTGEVSLRGRVLPVGGIKEKLVAAHRAGATRVVIPARNKKDLLDLPEAVQQQLQVVLVRSLPQALDAVLQGGLPRDCGMKAIVDAQAQQAAKEAGEEEEDDAAAAGRVTGCNDAPDWIVRARL